MQVPLVVPSTGYLIWQSDHCDSNWQMLHHNCCARIRAMMVHAMIHAMVRVELHTMIHAMVHSDCGCMKIRRDR